VETLALIWQFVLSYYLAIAGAVAGLYIAMQLLRRYLDFKRSLDLVFLKVLIPKKDSKEDKETDQEQFGTGKDFQKVTGIMVHLLQNLQAIFSSKFSAKIIGQDFFSLEYAVIEGEIYFFVVVPRSLEYTVEKQIASFYEDAIIDKVPDYNIFAAGHSIAGTSLLLAKSYGNPLNTFQNLHSETINPIVGAMAKISRDEGASLQFMLRPTDTNWQAKCQTVAEELLGGRSHGFAWYNPLAWIGSILKLIFTGGLGEEGGGADKAQVTQDAQDLAKLAADKAGKPGYDAIIRIMAAAPSQSKADSVVQSIQASFEQFSTAANGFISTDYHSTKTLARNYIFRSFKRSVPEVLSLWARGEQQMVLGIEEIASMFHLPNIRYNPSVAIAWQDFKIEPAPPNLPKEGLLLGHNTYRGEKREIRIKLNDRRRHFYLIGKSGTGKSTLLETMIRQDLQNGHGLCVVDPHGDLVENVLPYIPRERADDVILFSPGDLERPMGLNMLEGNTPDEREFMAQEALAIFIKMFGEEIMGPRLQDYFRNGALTLMEDEDEGATLIDLTRLFADEEWQRYKVSKVKNPVVRNFWTKQMANTGQREKQEIIPYFASKFGPFVTNGQIRNIIGQTKSGFNIPDIMNNKKILLCNLSKGKLGDINAQLIGSILVAKIQMAAMARASIPEDQRADFFLYVDEFQNFVTDSFASILSEARKYRLGLIVAHQYISQITKMKVGGKGTTEDTTIRDAVFGNVGSMMCFKIGAGDAETMGKEFAPTFTEQDLINIANYKACIKLNIDGTTSRGFTLETLYDTSGADHEAAEAIRQLSRLKYGRDREFVEAEIFKRVT